ncbi:MAG: ERF family protein [Actinomycetota bacterium]|nr:ERF family protein [Actinomycetota bacterium]
MSARPGGEHDTSGTQPEPRNVTEAIARIMGELGGIGKTHQAAPQQGGYAYRGIEDITKRAQSLLSRYGVAFYPRGEITEIREIEVNGKPWTDAIVSVEYEIVHGPSDTSRTIRVPGIGRDNSDKGSNKGMTQAFKYALIQTLCIADPKDDADGTTAEADAGSRVVRQETTRREPPKANTQPAGLISNAQLRLVAVLLNKLGIPDESKRSYVAELIGITPRPARDLTSAEALKLIDELKKESE